MDAFEDLEVWKRSNRLAVDIYRVLESSREYGLKDQVVRAVISISSNIAEGFERNSNKQFAHFLTIAKGSCGELRSQLYIRAEIGMIEKTIILKFHQEAVEISRMLQALIKRCRMRDSQ
jgi:four helix bundle protein